MLTYFCAVYVFFSSTRRMFLPVFNPFVAFSSIGCFLLLSIFRLCFAAQFPLSLAFFDLCHQFERYFREIKQPNCQYSIASTASMWYTTIIFWVFVAQLRFLSCFPLHFCVFLRMEKRRRECRRHRYLSIWLWTRNVSEMAISAVGWACAIYMFPIWVACLGSTFLLTAKF